jgi:hypothetical protein
MLNRVIVNVRKAAALFMTDDARAARLLVAEKEAFRDMEAAATASHFGPILSSKRRASCYRADCVIPRVLTANLIVLFGCVSEGFSGAHCAEPRVALCHRAHGTNF